jgi:hypothetical protein
MHLENLTPYAATAVPTLTVAGDDLLLTVVAGRFLLPPAGKPSHQPPRRSEAQPDVPLEDVYWGQPDASSLRIEGQSAPVRLGTDVWIVGQAWTQKGRAAQRVDTALVIPGRINKGVAVFGDRVWTQGIGGITATAARPFVSMPLVYERAFGGAEKGDASVRAFETRNPVGRGFQIRESDAIGEALPNLEDPRDLIRSWRDRPRPMCYGPIARSWQPRVRFGGTYDQKWLEELAPMWPPDLDPLFFQSAPQDQQVHPRLVGGEPVGLTGFAPDGDIQFVLPTCRLQLKSVFEARVTWQLLHLDAVIIEPDAGAFTVIWRASTPLPDGPLDHDHAVLRELFAWENSPS